MPRKSSGPQGHHTYVSVLPEVQPFRIVLDTDVELRGYQDEMTKVVRWHVPAELVDRFDRHWFVSSGRIVREDQ